MQQGKPGTPLVYEAFDVLEVEGEPLVDLPLRERRRRLEQLVDRRSKIVRISEAFDDGEALYDAAKAQALEGIVAKRADSPYRQGKRTREWLKIKTHGRQEFVIAGYTKGQGRRLGRFGALVLGTWQGDELVYAGNVGTGFTDRTIDELLAKLRPLETKEPPFREVPKMPKVRKADVVWVKPELVAEVEFVEWTHDNRLRAPSFQGLREDKPAREVHREEPLPAEIRKGSRVLKLSNLDKVFFPEDGITKGDLLAYYRAVAPVLLPHLKDRPFTLKRYPNGIHEQFFFQKDKPKGMPDWIADPAVPGLDARAAAAEAHDRRAARQRRARPALDGEHGLHRPEHVVLARRQARPAGLRALRPRSRGGRRLSRDDPGRPPRQGGARRSRARRLPEDERQRRHPRPRPGRAAIHLRGHSRVRRDRRRDARPHASAGSSRRSGRRRSAAAC